MKINKISFLVKQTVTILVAAVAFCSTPTNAAPGYPSMAIKFCAGQTDSSGISSSITNAAGVLNTTNWNNLNGNANTVNGSTTSLNYDDSGATSVSVAGLNWNMGSAGSGTAASSSGIGFTNENLALMNTFLDSGTSVGTSGHPQVIITNLDSVFTASNYDVYVYFNGQSGNTRGGQYLIMDSTGVTTIALWNCGFTTPNFPFADSTFVQDITPDNTTYKTETPGCNYIVFTNLSASSFMVTGSGGVGVTDTGSKKTPICGIEIVAHATVAPLTAPQIIIQPTATQMLYTGLVAHLTVLAAGTTPFSYQWWKGSSLLNNGGNISGSKTNILTIGDLSASDATNYIVVVTNIAGSVTSSVAQLMLVTPDTAYEPAVLSNNPAAYYRLNEDSDTIDIPELPAFDYVSGFNGIYGGEVENSYYGAVGPFTSEGCPGFESTNGAADFLAGYAGSQITTLPWNLNTNTVTITAWINPSGQQASAVGLVFCRGGSDVSGLNYSVNTNADGNYSLGYTWNNDPNTYGWSSGLEAPQNQWSLVALVVTPTNATIYVLNTNGIASSVFINNHAVAPFATPSTIGQDPFNANRTFNGYMDEVAVFNQALLPSQLTKLLTAATGLTYFPPVITTEPAATQTLYQQQTAQFTVQASGTAPLTYQWQAGTNGVYVNLNNGGRISGLQTATLTITNLALSDPTNYLVVITNAYGSVTSSVATLTITPTGPATNITMSVVESNSQDWDTAANWSINLSATTAVIAYPGSTFEVLSGALLRTPATPVTATFPGNVLTIDGNGVWTSGGGGSIGEIRLKGAQPLSTVSFNKLVMNGGQIQNGVNNSANVLVNGGEVNILANTPIYTTDVGGGGSVEISSWLTGNGNIEYYAYPDTPFANQVSSLNISGATNTYSGTWNVVDGTLVGSALNALGTNTITVGTNGALQTTYDINNTNGSLILNGLMNLTQNDKFKNVIVGGVTLSAGTYTFVQLNSTYPANFPATWTAQPGAASTTGSGSITVGTVSGPVVLTNSWNGTTLTLTWSGNGLLLQATNVTGPWTTNVSPSPFTVMPTTNGPRMFYCIQVQ
jgi:hypothetical protein